MISDDTPPKRLVWALAIATLLVAVTVAALMYVYGVPPVITSLLDRTVTEASSEDYAAYSAFVESFFSSSQPFRADQSIGRDNVVYIVDETLLMRSPGSILPLDVAALGPSDMGEDFFRQNARTWRLEPHFHARSRLLLVGREMVQRAAWSGAKELYEEPKKGEESKWLLHASRLARSPTILQFLECCKYHVLASTEEEHWPCCTTAIDAVSFAVSLAGSCFTELTATGVSNSSAQVSCTSFHSNSYLFLFLPRS